MASIKIGNVTYGAEELSKTFQTYRKEFVIMPFLAMEQLAKHMNVRTGIRYRETVSQMSTDAEISNYSKTKHQDADVKIDPRVFETFFGNIVQGIDPNAIYQSIWGSNVTKGDGLKNVPIVVQVCGYLVKKIGEKMFMNSFTAKHDSTDTTSTSKWFNGFQTILENDVAGTNYTNKVLISADIGNLVEGAESITADNAEDLIKDFYWNQVGNPAAAAKLRSQQLKLFMSDQAYHFYTESYLRCPTTRLTTRSRSMAQAMSSSFRYLACLTTSCFSRPRTTLISSSTRRRMMISSLSRSRLATTTTLTSS